MARKITGTRILKNGSRQIYVFTERRTRNGRLERKSKTEITTLSKSADIEARRREMREELLAELQAGKNDAAAKDLLLIEYLDKWLAEVCAGKLAVRTLSDYKYHIKNFLVPFLNEKNPDLLLKDLSPVILHDLFIFMKKCGKNYAARKMKQVLSSACSNAVRWGLLRANPVSSLRVELPPKKEKKILSPLEAARFLAACAYLPIEVYLRTGLRPSELVALRWSDIDFAQNRIFIRQSLVRPAGGGFAFKEPKSSKSIRKISITENLAEKLRQHEKEQIKLINYRKRKNYKFENYGLVFCSRFGSPLHIHNLNLRDLKGILKKANLPLDISLYSLRHSIASILLAGNANLKDVQELLGHSNPTVTLNNYIHSMPDAQVELTNRFTRIIDESGVIEVEGKAN